MAAKTMAQQAYARASEWTRLDMADGRPDRLVRHLGNLPGAIAADRSAVRFTDRSRLVWDRVSGEWVTE